MLIFDIFENVGTAIAHVDPGDAVGGRADRLAPLFPEPTLAARAIAAVLPGLALGGPVAAGEDLAGQADDGAGGGVDGQSVVTLVAAAVAVADLAEAVEGGHRGVVQLGGVVDQQDGVGGSADEAEGAPAVGSRTA